ncbi:MAG: BatD family protein [Chitinophagales bacterium]|nr:BatD family protein [Chitinophagales bacterium]
MTKQVFFAGLFFITTHVCGQKFIATMEADSEVVAKNQPITLTLTINARVDGINMPVFADFNVLSEPGNKATYTDIVEVDDKPVEKVRLTYTSCIIPKYDGKFTIDAFTFTIGAQKIKTNTLEITVENRRVSWSDSADVASKCTGFSIGYEGSGVATKTAIDYNKADKTLVPKETQIGKGTPSFEIKAEKLKYTVKAGEQFVVVYQVYKEAPKDEFKENVEVMPLEDMEGLILVDGPARHFKVQSNSTTKIQSGTADILVEAAQRGKYIIPSVRVKYGDIIISAPVIEIIVE